MCSHKAAFDFSGTVLRPRADPRKVDIDALLFSEDEDASKNVMGGPMRHRAAGRGSEAVGATQEANALTLGLSRRKQAQLEASERKQRDKYAEEKETEVGQLQSLEDAEQESIANKVWIQLCLHRGDTTVRVL